MDVYNTALVLLFFCHNFILLDGFQWSFYQQSNHIINVVLGSDVSLPCEYLLTPQEQHEADIFHLLTWTREEPLNSDNWAGLAIKSTLTGSEDIYDDPQHIFLTNDTLHVTNVSAKDHTRYQCSFQSSFFTSPSTIELNVQYKPTETQISSSVEPVEEGKPLVITCTARANPSAEYKFYHDGKLISSSSTGVLTFVSVKSEDQGTYRCVPYNRLGEGPEATVTVTVEDKPTETQISSSVEPVEEGKPLVITCTARANPSAEYKFYHDGKLISLSSTGVLTFVSVKSEDQGTYRCVPYNRLGEGPEATVTVTVEDEEKFPVWAYGAIGGGVLLVILIAAVIAFCRARKQNKSDKRGKRSQNNVSRDGDTGANIGRTFYGEQMDRGREIGHLNAALSFNDIRTSREIPVVLKGAMSANDVRVGENPYATIQDAYPTRSVIQLIEANAEMDSTL